MVEEESQNLPGCPVWTGPQGPTIPFFLSSMCQLAVGAMARLPRWGNPLKGLARCCPACERAAYKLLPQISWPRQWNEASIRAMQYFS